MTLPTSQATSSSAPRPPRPSLRLSPSSRGARTHHPPGAWPSLFGDRVATTAAPKRRTIAPGLTIGPIGIGTWAWGNRFLYGYSEAEDAALAEAYAAALSAGFNLFDTADSYGTGRLSGRAESLLGAFAASSTPRAAPLPVAVATKIAPYPWRLTAGQWVRAAAASAARAGGPPLALAQLHWSTAAYAPWQERATWDGLIAAYDAGICTAVGVSNFGPTQLKRVAAYLGKAGVPLAAAQVQCSLLSAGPPTRAALDAAAELGVTSLAYSPLGLGMLSGAYGPPAPGAEAAGKAAAAAARGGRVRAPRPRYPPGPRGALFRRVLPSAQELLLTIASIAAAKKASPSQIALAWCCALDTVPIPGARSAAHVASHAGAARVRLSSSDVAALDAAAAGVGSPMVQNVFSTR